VRSVVHRVSFLAALCTLPLCAGESNEDFALRLASPRSRQPAR
jgi:hypothetical protein